MVKMLPAYIFALAYLTGSYVQIAWSSTVSYHDNCIIGAGPSGLQIGYFFSKARRDYVIFEKSNISGSFYQLYPRHRKLISINKRHTGKTNKEFNLRHDWNSLISDDESLLFKHYSKVMFPHAGDLVRYLNDYQRKLNINVQFNTQIGNIHTVDDKSAKDGHSFYMEDQNGNHYQCRTLVMANGISKPAMLNVTGHEYIEGYESLDLDPETFEGQSVLILGRGNSAFELASSIYGNTNVIHMIGRTRMRFAWSTHYVGDLRAVNNELLDTYQLKTLDGMLEADLDAIKFFKTAEGRYVVDLSELDDQRAVLKSKALRDQYDRIIRCLGFKVDTSVWKNQSLITWGEGKLKKFPGMTQHYESTDAAGLYYAGVLTHSVDFRKSAGGFIHGYRYTSRALFRILDNKYEGEKWPSVTLKHTDLFNYFLRRANEASGIYQMFEYLGDIALISEDGRTVTYIEEFPIRSLHKLEELSGHNVSRLIVMVMQYGESFSGPANDVFRSDRAIGAESSNAHHANFLHPTFYYYKKSPLEIDMQTKGAKDVLPRPDRMHFISEDFLTLWDDQQAHVVPFRRFIETCFDTDLRHFFADSCFQYAMTHRTAPAQCEEYYMEGLGLTASNMLLTESRIQERKCTPVR